MIEPIGTRVVVSCMGDVEVLDFPLQDGTAWVLLRDGPRGEPGRKSEDLEPINLSETRGVLFGMRDPRSAQALIDAFTKAKGELEVAR